MCEHEIWIKLCVLCGDVIDDSEFGKPIVASAEMNKTTYFTPPNTASTRLGAGAAKNDYVKVAPSG